MKVIIDVCVCEDYQFSPDAIKKNLTVDLNYDNIKDSSIDAGVLASRLVIDAMEEHFANDQKTAESEIDKEVAA